MPSIPALVHSVTSGLAKASGKEAWGLPDNATYAARTLAKRVTIPFNVSTASPGMVEAASVDPFSKSDKYARGWIYFCVVLLAFAIVVNIFHLWTDKVRTAQHTDRLLTSASTTSPPQTPDGSNSGLFARRDTHQPHKYSFPMEPQSQSSISSFRPLNGLFAVGRYIFYRPTPVFKLGKRWGPVAFPSWAVLVIAFAALAFSALYCFLPQPLYRSSIRYGSPPISIRSGMIAVAMIPWLVALSMKANLITLLTGIGHERLNVLHRWGGWLCLFLSLVHTIPFYVQPITDRGGYRLFISFFGTGIYIYGTGMLQHFHTLVRTRRGKMGHVRWIISILNCCYFKHTCIGLPA